jgi:MerR family transcriptional regulator, thiopeptide resistance regulator
MDTWSVGELAAQTGLTVRTLHHYDEIGLARPSERTAAGHRRYTGADVRRLHRIVALRGFGFTLAEIAALLDATEPDPRELVRRQLAQANERIARTTRLRDRLDAVLRVFDAAGSPSAAVLVGLIEGMTTVNTEEFEQMAAHRRAMTARLTPAELAEMSARRQAMRDSLTPEQLAALERSRPKLIDLE